MPIGGSVSVMTGPVQSPALTRVRKTIVVVVAVVSLGCVVSGYRGVSPVLAWQMFPEASTWQADVVRVGTDGERTDIRVDWPGGYKWSELVPSRGLSAPWSASHASYGTDATIANLQAALDWVARNTPLDTETAYLEATVTYRRNADAPQVVVLRSVERADP